MIRADRLKVVVALCLGFGLTFSAYAQNVAIAEISGSVADPSGSAIGGAQVKMTETDKQLVRSTVSDDQGRYTLPNLPVGPYRLEVSAPGFKGFSQTGIVLQVGNNVQVNVTMQVGSVSESIEVTASAGMVETKDTTIFQVIDEKAHCRFAPEWPPAHSVNFAVGCRAHHARRRHDWNQELL
jgi:hypothetical protein